MRNTITLIILFSCLISGCHSDPWFRDGNRFWLDQRFAFELDSFWDVTEANIAEASSLLENKAVVVITAENAEYFIGYLPEIQLGNSFYLIRAIDLKRNAVPIRVHYSEGLVHVGAGTTSTTCFLFKPEIRRRPLVIELFEKPEQVATSYFCDGP